MDDLIILPLGIMLAVRLIPPAIIAEHRASASAALLQPRSYLAAAAIVGLWVAAAAAFAAWAFLPKTGQGGPLS